MGYLKKMFYHLQKFEKVSLKNTGTDQTLLDVQQIEVEENYEGLCTCLITGKTRKQCGKKSPNEVDLTF